MNTKEFVHTFEDGLEEVLSEKLKVLSEEKKELEERVGKFRKLAKDVIIREKTPEPEVVYKMACMHVAKEERRLAEVIAELDYIIRAVRELRGKNNEDLDTQLAKEHPIEEFIKDIRKTGRLLVGSCPFHQEKMPSFTIYPGNTYYCFSCQRGGDSIDFIMQLENLTFPEAVRRLS